MRRNRGQDPYLLIPCDRTHVTRGRAEAADMAPLTTSPHSMHVSLTVSTSYSTGGTLTQEDMEGSEVGSE